MKGFKGGTFSQVDHMSMQKNACFLTRIHLSIQNTVCNVFCKAVQSLMENYIDLHYKEFQHLDAKICVASFLLAAKTPFTGML